jgi:hypothetical protein
MPLSRAGPSFTDGRFNSVIIAEDNVRDMCGGELNTLMFFGPICMCS